MKGATREPLDDDIQFSCWALVGWLQTDLLCFASSSYSVGWAMVTLFYFGLFASCCKRAQGFLKTN